MSIHILNCIEAEEFSVLASFLTAGLIRTSVGARPTN